MQPELCDVKLAKLNKPNRLRFKSAMNHPNQPLMYFWNRSVDFYRELRRIPELVNETVAAGGTRIEFIDCQDSIRTLFDELPSLIPFITKPQHAKLKELVLEAADRFNAYLELLRAASAGQKTLDELNQYYDQQLVHWGEATYLDYVAGLLVPAGDDGPRDDLIEKTQQLFELKPNIAGIGLNLNALISWMRNRRTSDRD